MPDWITAREASEPFGYHPEYFRRLAGQGKLGAEKKSQDWWIDRNSPQAYHRQTEALGTKKRTPGQSEESGGTDQPVDQAKLGQH